MTSPSGPVDICPLEWPASMRDLADAGCSIVNWATWRGALQSSVVGLMDDTSQSLETVGDVRRLRAGHRRSLLGAGRARARSRSPSCSRSSSRLRSAGSSVGWAASRLFSRRSRWCSSSSASPAGAWRGRWTIWPRICPRYRANILAKIADVRGAGKGGSVEKLQETIEDIKTDLGQSERPRERPRGRSWSPPSGVAGFSGFAWLGPIVGPLGTAGLVLAMVIFMLLERRDLRDRLIGLFGHGRLTVTTKAFDEAGTRVSRQLLMQSLVNLVYGVVAGLGLYCPRRAVPVGLGDARCGAAVHPVRRPRDRRRRADPGQPCRPPGLGRSALGASACSSCSSCSRTSCSKPCCMRGRPASRRWRCSCRWRSGRGCGARSACSWRHR